MDWLRLYQWKPGFSFFDSCPHFLPVYMLEHSDIPDPPGKGTDNKLCRGHMLVGIQLYTLLAFLAASDPHC